MYFGKKTVGGTYEILAADDFFAIPATITKGKDGDIVKAGMPINDNGEPVADGAGAVGILLYDVDITKNPNAALVTIGYVDWTKCKELSGATASAEVMRDVLPAITFRENIGVNE